MLSRLGCFTVLLACAAFGQTTVATGSIQGTVTDPAGAVIPGAKVTITGQSTGQVLSATTSNSGTYSSGALIPGDYQVRVIAQGFRTAELNLTVQVGGAANGNVAMELGQSTQVVEVSAAAVTINTEQATVQGVLTAQQIDNLPINGRNFLDLAQLEPGVQIQDGTNFDPTKVGYSSISFGGRFGRTARIAVDGVDVSDETVGTTTQDIASSAIQEFQISQSNLDLSNDLTSSGAVNVITRSGTNEFHGEAFYYLRDSRLGAQIPHPVGIPAPYQRNQFGGRFGGPLLKDKLFFFIDAERTKQDSSVPVQYPAPFNSFSGSFGAPFREVTPMARLDWQATKSLRVFARFNYFNSDADATFFSSSLQVYKNKNYTRTYVTGADFNTGAFTHSIRFSNLKFENGISDATLGTGLPLANLGLTLAVTNGPATGPNYLAPQATLQLDRQLKYDGGRPLGNHFLRYGVNYNFIQVGGFASFFKLAPYVLTNLIGTEETDPSVINGPYPGGAGNPLNYPVELVIVGNGQGYSTEHPALGYPAGGLGPDNRFAFYVGDSWKLRKNLTLTYGLRYVHDTGRTDSDLATISALDAAIPGTGGRVNNPDKNFAPQIGLAWDPTGSGKTVIRAGSGLFYENVIFNNVLFDRPLRLQSGAFLQFPTACVFGTPAPIAVPGGSLTPPSQLCNENIGQAAAGLAAFESQYQAATPFNLSAANPNFVGSLLSQGLNVPLGLFSPDYKTPRSLQINAGIQRQIKPGIVFTADYVRNVTTHTLLGIDANHTGDTNYFNKNTAQAAINTTLQQCGVSTIDQAIANCNGSPATISNFVNNGLGDNALAGSAGGAFGGINPAVGSVPLLYPIGRSVYNGLDMKLNANWNNPFRGLHHATFQVAYSLSRFVNNGGSNPSTPGNSDQDFVISAIDQRNPLGFTGPSLLDRTNQLSFGGFFDLPGGFRASVISHFYSGLPVTLVVPNTGLSAGEIFATDFTGDGTVQDVLPGTKVGSFNRDFGVTGLTSTINNYNSTIAGQPTPAGQVLISSGLFSLQQLQELGAVAPSVALPPNGQVGVGMLRAFDLSLSWVHKFGERVEIEPKIAFYNLFNFANFDLPPNVISGLLTGTAGSINGTTQADRIDNRVGLGTGVFALGAPRAIEIGIRLSF